ncbi:MAG TPA: MBL fold metallo-hydrolase [Acidimicrobiia bacterium]|nr:MBL fold metallo-hydrolase [Acidimicrobiia bacterium]
MTMRPRQVGRRQFLVNLGKGAVGLAVFGFAACADDARDATTRAPTTTSTTGATSTTAGPGTTESPGTTVPGSLATVQRVDLGFVSAYIVAREGAAAVIDTGTSGSQADIESGLGVLGLGWPSVGHVIFTHHHGDHIGSAGAVLSRAAAAQAYAGADDIPRLGQVGPVNAVGDGDRVFGLDMVATPGHTPGHISVLDPVARFLIAGDALNGQPDGGGVLGPNPGFTADMGVAIQSARKLAMLDYDDAYFGHGEPLLGGASAAVAALAETLEA